MIPRIRRIYIQNFRSIDRTVVDLEPLTVLVGPNGAGKSNFVGALEFFQRCVTEGLEQVFRFSTPNPRWHVELEQPPLGFKVELDLSPDATAVYSFLIRPDIPEPLVERETCSVFHAGVEIAGFEVADGNFVREISGIRPQLSGGRLALAAASAVPEFRPVYDLIAGILTYSIHPKEVCGFSGSTAPNDTLSTKGSNAPAVLRAIQEKFPEVHARIERLMAQAVGGITGIRTKLGEQWQSIEFMKDLGDDQPSLFLAHEMSDGTLRLLGLLLAIYQPRRPSVLVIEEPEATVHPAIAELVMQVFLDAGRRQQVILTTHSPDLLDAKELSDDQIRVVSQQHGRTVIAPLGRASRQAIRDRLYTPGELLRLAELDDDADGALAAAAACDPFAEMPAST